LRIFYQTLKIFNKFSRENHGHDGHEHGVGRGFPGGKLLFKKMSAKGRLCTLQEKSHSWVPTIKVRLSDGILMWRKRVTIDRISWPVGRYLGVMIEVI
jgi:hypothetical protein